MTMTGFDKLNKELNEFQAALKALNGEMASISVIPGDDQSVRAAIAQMERAVDAKVGRFRSNAMVTALAAATKQNYATEIRKMGRATLSRIGGE